MAGKKRKVAGVTVVRRCHVDLTKKQSQYLKRLQALAERECGHPVGESLILSELLEMCRQSGECAYKDLE